jgi:Ca2+-binding RTX toxin-like protein
VLKDSTTSVKVHHDLGPASPGISVFSGVTAIEMHLGAGNDLGMVSSQLSIPATMFGGSGDDNLVGGGGDDVLIGGGGFDLLLGMAGMDLLVGGQNSDIMSGDGGGDVFVGGDTSLDMTGSLTGETAQIQSRRSALDAVMDAWTTDDCYENRRDAVSGLLAGAIFDDDDVDLMNGGGGLDLFYAGDSGCLRDIIVGRLCGESVIELPEI